MRWPAALQDRDLLYYVAETFRARLAKELPADRRHASPNVRQFAYRAKALPVELAEISLEIAQLVVAEDEQGNPLPWDRDQAACCPTAPQGNVTQASHKYVTKQKHPSPT